MSMIPYRGNNLFGLLDSMERSFFNDSVSGISQFRTDITEKDGSYLLEAELPGFDPDDINVNVDGDTLTISAETSSNKDEKDDDGNYVRRERRWGSFSRSFDVSGIDVDSITADYQNGILKLTMPGKQQIQPESKKIQIGAGSGQSHTTATSQQQAQQGSQTGQPQSSQQNTAPVQDVPGNTGDTQPYPYEAYENGSGKPVPPTQ